MRPTTAPSGRPGGPNSWRLPAARASAAATSRNAPNWPWVIPASWEAKRARTAGRRSIAEHFAQAGGADMLFLSTGWLEHLAHTRGVCLGVLEVGEGAL